MLLPLPCTPAIEAVLQTAPRAALSAATAAWAQRNGPIRLVLRIVCQKSSVSRSSSANGIGAGVAGVPALLTRKSSRPSASIARVTIASPSPGFETLPGAEITRCPCLFSRSICSMPRGSSGRWFSATVAPARANASTVASPMPEAPPVTSAVFPERSAVIMSFLVSRCFDQDRPVACRIRKRKRASRYRDHITRLHFDCQLTPLARTGTQIPNFIDVDAWAPRLPLRYVKVNHALSYQRYYSRLVRIERNRYLPRFPFECDRTENPFVHQGHDQTALVIQWQMCQR